MEADCTTPVGTSCDFASATGSFAETSASGVVQGDIVSTFPTYAAWDAAAAGAANGYDDAANPDPNGLSYQALEYTDGMTL